VQASVVQLGRRPVLLLTGTRYETARGPPHGSGPASSGSRSISPRSSGIVSLADTDRLEDPLMAISISGCSRRRGLTSPRPPPSRCGRGRGRQRQRPVGEMPSVAVCFGEHHAAGTGEPSGLLQRRCRARRQHREADVSAEAPPRGELRGLRPRGHHRAEEGKPYPEGEVDPSAGLPACVLEVRGPSTSRTVCLSSPTFPKTSASARVADP